jgi:hypothetical protein
MTATIQDRQVSFFPDPFEDNDLVANATPIPADGTVQSHTLFGPDDIDYLSFQAVSNTVYTLARVSNLRVFCEIATNNLLKVKDFFQCSICPNDPSETSDKLNFWAFGAHKRPETA